MITLQQQTNLDPNAPLGQAWEQLVQANPASGFMQSLHWAGFKRQRGLDVVHLTLHDSSELIGGMLMYVPKYVSSGTLLIAPHGPVIPWHKPELARTCLQKVRQAAEALAAEYNVIGLRIEPTVLAPRPPLLRDWSRAPVDMLELQSLQLDLTQTESQLLAGMKPKGRYNIRLAARRGISTRSTTDAAEIPLFYAILTEASERDQFYIEPIDHFSLILQSLAPAAHAQLIFAESPTTTLACMLLITYGTHATYLYGGTVNQQRSSMAGYALQWRAIQIAQGYGCTTYDFYGYEASGDPHHQYAGFSRFKRSFGGTPITCIGAHDFYWPDRVADVVIRAIQELTR